MTAFCLGWQKHNSVSRFSSILKKSMIVVAAGLFVFVLCVYLIQLNSIAAKGYTLRELENKIDLVKKENSRLAVQTVEYRAMSTLEERINHLSMVPTGEMRYWDASGMAFAKK